MTMQSLLLCCLWLPAVHAAVPIGETSGASWNSWMSWQACSKTCGGGTQTRFRYCYVNPGPGYHGQYCTGAETETQFCMTQMCPINGGWSGWGSWQACSKSCGGGIQTRTRACTNPAPANGGQYCPGSSTETQNCMTQLCPINGGWSDWGSLPACSKSCGGGIQTRTRTCTNPAPANGGQNCAGSSTETHNCSTQLCLCAGQPTYQAGCQLVQECCSRWQCTIVNGGWTGWNSWQACSTTCGSGTQTRTRTCTNPLPSNGGQYCPGSSTETQTCNTQSNTLDGSWSEWVNGPCTKSCDGGTRIRTRTCTNPAPVNCGKACTGIASETQNCNTQKCCDGRTADIAFIVDESGSITQQGFTRILNFVQDVIKGFTVGPNDVQFAMITFSSSVRLQFHLSKFSNRKDVLDAVNNTVYSGGGTRTDLGLRYAADNSFTTFNGARTDSPKMAIVLTDGVSDNATLTTQQAANLQSLGVTVFSVGVGNTNVAELNSLATDPDSERVFHVEDSSALEQIKTGLQNRMCDTTKRKCFWVFCL